MQIASHFMIINFDPSESERAIIITSRMRHVLISDHEIGRINKMIIHHLNHAQLLEQLVSFYYCRRVLSTTVSTVPEKGGGPASLYCRK